MDGLVNKGLLVTQQKKRDVVGSREKVQNKDLFYDYVDIFVKPIKLLLSISYLLA